MLFSKLHSERASGNRVKHVSDTTSIDESLQNTTNRHETSPLRSASLPNHPSLHQTRLLQKKPQKNSLTSALHPSHTPDTLFRKNSSHPQKPNFELGKKPVQYHGSYPTTCNHGKGGRGDKVKRLNGTNGRMYDWRVMDWWSFLQTARPCRFPCRVVSPLAVNLTKLLSYQ